MRWVTSFLAVLFLSQCQFQVEKNSQELVSRISLEPDVLNPILSTAASEMEIESFLFDSLLKTDNTTLEFQPNLAEAWEISSDQKQFTFHLRKDVLWHDGRPFTAEDVLFTFEKIQDPKVDSAMTRSYFKDVLKVEKEDDFTVRFLYRYPYFKAIHMLGGFQPLPKHLFQDEKVDFNQHSFSRAPIGTGPYRFKEWKTGRSILLERNESYWGEKPDIQQLSFKIIPEPAVALQLLKKGELDVLELNGLQWARQTDTPAFRKSYQKHRIDSPAGGYGYIGWNLRKPIFQDRKVRQAMAYLIDQQAIIDKLLFGLGRVTTGPVSSATDGYDHTLPLKPFDPEQAKRLLKESGWEDHDGDGWLDKKGEKFQFNLLFPSGSNFYEKFAPIFYENLKQVGIDVHLQRMEWVAFIREAEQRKYDAMIGGWSGGWPPEFYQIWHSSQSDQGSNHVGYKNSEVDRLLVEARREFDQSKRDAIHRKIHRIIYEDQPYLFLFETPSLVARHRRFQNVIEYKMGLDVKEWRVNASLPD